MNDDLTAIAIRIDNNLEGAWRLYHRPDRDSLPWRNLILQAPPGSSVKRYRLGWNGSRLAITKDYKTLRQRQPKIANWLREICPTIAAINDQRSTWPRVTCLGRVLLTRSRDGNGRACKALQGTVRVSENRIGSVPVKPCKPSQG